MTRVQLALLGWLKSDSVQCKDLLTAVTGLQVGRELLDRLSGQSQIDAYRVRTDAFAFFLFSPWWLNKRVFIFIKINKKCDTAKMTILHLNHDLHKTDIIKSVIAVQYSAPVSFYDIMKL